LLIAGTASAQGEIHFGDDSGDWSGNGECDDPRNFDEASSTFSWRQPSAAR